MEIIDLTPQELLFLDPTGKARQWMEKLQRSDAFKPLPPSPLFRISPEEMCDRYIALIAKLHLDEGYRAFNAKHLKMWAPQGGSAPWQNVQDGLMSYYDQEAAKDGFIHPTVIRGRDYLIKLIREHVELHGGVQYIAGLGVTGTAGGLPSMCRKGTFDAETMEMQAWSHLWPAIPGLRLMRGKLRNIFQDATINVRRIENILSSCKRWLVAEFPYFFSAWMNPWRYRNKIITKALDKHLSSVEWDYRTMDKYFRRQIALEVICPIYEAMIPGSTLMLYTYVEEAFSQPLFMGRTLWTGLHTLFSGLGITNDFETLYSLCLALGIALTLGISLEVLILGDDVSALVEKTKARLFMDMAIDISNQTGMHVHPLGEKSNIHDDHVEFCREYFGKKNPRYCGMVAGYYPSVLTLNNIVQPETLQPRVAAEVAADLQRLDGIQFNKEFAPVADLVRRFCTADLTAPADELPRDWWMRVYNERWDPQSSASYRYYNDGKISHQIRIPTE